MRPHELLNQIVERCAHSPLVTAYTVRTVDLDILSLRIHLVDESFIDVFHNDATNKSAFALIENGQRLYGKDNAKIGWHVHPLGTPLDHLPCNPVTFAEFFAEVEALRFSSATGAVNTSD